MPRLRTVLGSAGLVDDGADQDRRADRVDGALDRRGRGGVGVGVDVGGVLRPDHQLPGCGLRPGVDLGGRGRSVASTWLSSTAAAARTRPARLRGTLPWTTATVTVVRPSAAGTGSRRSATTRTQRRRPRPAATGSAAGRLRPVSTAAASRVPDSATAKRHQRHPADRGEARLNGASAWANASRPHGKPPNGTADRSHLGRDPQAGGPRAASRGSRLDQAWRPTTRASRRRRPRGADSSTQASAPMTSSQRSSSRKNASPKTSPSSSGRRSRTSAHQRA